MDNDHHEQETPLGEMMVEVVRREAEHAAEHAVNSPAVINRAIGEAMNHIGALLEMGSAPYLPIRPEEVLVEPVKLRADSADAVILINRRVTSDNGFLVLGTGKTVKDHREFDILCMKPDNFSLTRTKFIKPPQEVGNEIIRQLNHLFKGDGHILVQCVIVNNHFKVAEDKDEELFSSVAPDVAPKSALPPVAYAIPSEASGLPPVVDEELL